MGGFPVKAIGGKASPSSEKEQRLSEQSHGFIRMMIGGGPIHVGGVIFSNGILEKRSVCRSFDASKKVQPPSSRTFINGNKENP